MTSLTILPLYSLLSKQASVSYNEHEWSKATIQQCTVVFDIPIDIASFLVILDTLLDELFQIYRRPLRTFFPGINFWRNNITHGMHVCTAHSHSQYTVLHAMSNLLVTMVINPSTDRCHIACFGVLKSFATANISTSLDSLGNPQVPLFTQTSMPKYDLFAKPLLLIIKLSRK